MNAPIKVVIADDDKLFLNDLVNMIDWKACGFEIVGLAENGKQAMKLWRAVRPQLVITDIIMPLVNGLELLEAIEKENAGTHMLIMSSYNDFDYAQKAISLGVADYIIKNDITPYMLAQKLRQIRTKITNLQQEKLSLVNTQLSAALESDVPVPHLSELFPSRYHFCVIADPFGFSPWGSGPTQESARENARQLSSRMRDFGGPTYAAEICFYHYEYTVVGIRFFDSRAVSREDTLRMRRELALHAPRRMMFFTDGALSLEEFRLLFRRCRQKLFYFRAFPDDAEDSMEKIDRLETGPSAGSPSLIALSRLESPRAGEAHAALTEYLETIRRSFSLEHCVHLYQSLVPCDADPEMMLRTHFRSFGRFSDAMRELFEQSAETGPAPGANGYSQRVRETMDYIEKNYGDADLGIDQIAEAVVTSSSYLCVLFKRETGKTINQYITEFRIQKAIALLKNSKLKIYEICEHVGYTSPQYFTKIFHATTGRRPIDYRTPAGE